MTKTLNQLWDLGKVRSSITSIATLHGSSFDRFDPPDLKEGRILLFLNNGDFGTH